MIYHTLTSYLVCLLLESNEDIEEKTQNIVIATRSIGRVGVLVDF